MNLCSVLFLAALFLGVCTASAETISASEQPPAIPNWVPSLQPSFSGESQAGSSLFGPSPPQGRVLALDIFAENTAESNGSLVGSLDGVQSTGDWTLFLSDVDFGQKGAPVKWGSLVTAIPEPSSVSLIAIAVAAFAARAIRRR